MNRTILLSFILLLFAGCSNTLDEKQKNDLHYFDIKGYFEKEAARLKKDNLLIKKTVSVNGSAERREIKIMDWTKELSLFADADINRASWKGLFQYKKLENQELYTSNNEKVPVKELHIYYSNSEITGFKILIKNTNSLYSSFDTLTYYPDSLYQVKKVQNIKLLSKRTYTITGIFK